MQFIELPKTLSNTGLTLLNNNTEWAEWIKEAREKHRELKDGEMPPSEYPVAAHIYYESIKDMHGGEVWGFYHAAYRAVAYVQGSCAYLVPLWKKKGNNS